MAQLRNYVAEVGSDIALPLARAYCTAWKIAHDPAAGEDMWWAGAFLNGSLRGVIGLASLGDAGLLVTGVFTDGSEHAARATKMLLSRLSDVPCEIMATLHLPTATARRAFAKHGWRLTQGVI